jgi:intracellular sulfur oxidation DsrE/DsrF family protein
MKKIATILTVLALSICFLFITLGSASGAESESLQGMQSFKAVFDVRTGKAKSAVMLLDLIHQMHKDKNVRAITSEPEFALIFIGPSVKLISTQTKGSTPEEEELLKKIAATITAMAKDGIKLEICLFAADVFGIGHATILPEIKQVGNGWISMVGYQDKGYALVPVY